MAEYAEYTEYSKYAEYAEHVAKKLDKQNFLKIPLSKAVALFSTLFFIIIAAGSSTAYYFSMQKVLIDSFENELWQVINTRQLILNANIDREILILKILSETPAVKQYFLEPENEANKEACFSLFNHYKDFFHGKMLGWISLKDTNYYINGRLMEKYSHENASHLWFFETLKYKNPPTIRVDFDYINNNIYDLYIDYPIYHNGNAIGVINGRISLFEFVTDLNLPENVYVFGKDGIIIGAADERIAREKKMLTEQFKQRGEEVYKRSLGLGKSSSDRFDFKNKHYLIRHVEDLDLFLTARFEIGIKEIMKERASIVFMVLLLLMLATFVVFNKFTSRILKPINDTMLSYMRSSLLDELTKLPNKRFLNMRMEDEWGRAIRAKYPVSFLMMDLDKFKNYNDSHGHLEGDLLLRESARIFNKCVNRSSDFVARFGGEEFCVILSNTKQDGAQIVAENLRSSMEKAGKITISIGIVCKVPSKGENYKDFMESADKKLYEAKNSGRNKACV